MVPSMQNSSEQLYQFDMVVRSVALSRMPPEDLRAEACAEVHSPCGGASQLQSSCKTTYEHAFVQPSSWAMWRLRSCLRTCRRTQAGGGAQGTGLPQQATPILPAHSHRDTSTETAAHAQAGSAKPHSQEMALEAAQADPDQRHGPDWIRVGSKLYVAGGARWPCMMPGKLMFLCAVG